MAQLCPDHQLLSMYFDGELPSPWKEKMEAHIVGCIQCARQLEAYQRGSLKPSSAAAAGEDQAAVESARQRVWQKLEQHVQNQTQRPAHRFYPGAGVWHRSISVPLPAAAAIVLVIFLAFFAVLRITGTSEQPIMTFASEAELDTPGIIPVSDMADVLRYLDSSDSNDLIILRLPESRSFVNYGEPAMLNAADYSRNVSNRSIDRPRNRGNQNVSGRKR